MLSVREPGQAVVAGPREAGPAGPPAPRPDGPAMPPHHTALRGLLLVALHHGCRLLPEQLAATDARDTLGSAPRMMRGAGFRCRTLSRRRWEHVAALGKAYPAMAVYRTGRWVVVIGPADGPGGPGLMVLDAVTGLRRR